MSSGRGSSALLWIKVIQWCGKKLRVAPKVPDDELDRISNHAEKVFYWMGNGSLVGGIINIEFLPELRQLKEHRFRFVGHISSEI